MMSLPSEVLIFADSVIFNSTGLLFVVLGVVMSIRMAGFPDLTVDGSFTIGAACYSVLLASGWGTPLALCIALAAGSFGGLLTWAINDRLGVGKVVSGVLSMLILILSAPYVSGGSTKGLLNVVSVFTKVDVIDGTLSRSLIGYQPYQTHLLFSLLWLSAFLLILSVLITALRTRIGLRLRYVGSAESPRLTPRREQRLLLLVGLMVGNSMVALGGAIEAQRRGGYTNNMGIGMILIALAVLILGEALLKSFRKRDYLRLKEYAVALVLGSLVYCAGIQFLLALRIDFVDLRLLTAVFLLVLLGIAGRTYSSSTKLF